MLREIRDLGFDYAELSHGIRISLLPGIIEAVQAGEIKISSLHNFCPLPIGVNHAAPNIFKFSSLDERERENAYRYSMKTLETAARLKAPLVVLHMGCVDIKDYTGRLLDLAENGQKDSPKYEKICQEAVAKRMKYKARHAQHAYDMLRRLAPEAAARGLKLGIENREAVEEIPFEDEFSLFFKEFPDACIGYWHDTGHAQIKENLGFINHAMHLETLADRLLGFHLHDVAFPGGDHRPPGTGDVDFAAMKPHVKPEHLKVFELGPGLPPEAVLEGVRHVKSLWGEA